jgi:hypothetical protein
MPFISWDHYRHDHIVENQNVQGKVPAITQTTQGQGIADF